MRNVNKIDSSSSSFHDFVKDNDGDDDYNDPSALCVMTVGGVYGIPIFNHAGASFDTPVPCNCSQHDSLNLTSSYANCNLFNFLSGFLFWPAAGSSPTYALQLAIDYNYDYAVINTAAFNASFINSYFAYQSPYGATYQTQNYRDQVFQFCEVKGTACSMVVFTSFDATPNQINWAISDYYFQLNQGACRDTFTPSTIAWKQLIDEPFAPLSQSYLECKNSPTVVLLNQVGIAMGNLHLFAPFIALFVAAVYYLFPWRHLMGNDDSSKRKRSSDAVVYGRVELDRANEVLAYALLLARDNRLNKKVKSHSENEADSTATVTDSTILQQLTAELAMLHHCSNKNEEEDDDRNNSVSNLVGGNRGSDLRSRLLSEDQFRSSELVEKTQSADDGEGA